MTDFKKQIADNELTQKLTKKLSKEKILSFLLLKDDTIVYEYYQNNKVGSELQKINSCTKSIAGTLIGICLDKGYIEDINTPITEYFADAINNEPDIRKRDITLYHLLTMTPGLDWPEFGEWNCFAPMVYSDNIVEFILKRDLTDNPGEKMIYNSGCSHLLGVIIQKVTGMSVLEFAKKELFEPLGITEYKWYDSHGQYLTADGLRLKTLDLLKIGYLYLNRGVYNGKRILSENWVEEAVKPLHQTYDGIGAYGYQWWVSSAKIKEQEIPFYFALGYMGQFIIVIPSYNIVIAINSRLKDSLKPLAIVREMIGDLI